MVACAFYVGLKAYYIELRTSLLREKHIFVLQYIASLLGWCMTRGIRLPSLAAHAADLEIKNSKSKPLPTANQQGEADAKVKLLQKMQA